MAVREMGLSRRIKSSTAERLTSRMAEPEMVRGYFMTGLVHDEWISFFLDEIIIARK